MGPEDAFCGECGARVPDKESIVPETEFTTGNTYPLAPMILTAGLILILLFIQSQLESDGLYDDWLATDNYRLFVTAVGCIIASLTGIIVGSYIIIRSVQISARKFHGFSVFFLTSFVAFLGTEFLLVMFGPWDYIDVSFSITSAALFAIVAGLIIVGMSSLSSGKS